MKPQIDVSNFPPMTPDEELRVREAIAKAIEAAETTAARRAMEVYGVTLLEELAKIPGTRTIMQALGGTLHVHHALTDGDAKGVIVCAFKFDDSPEAIRKAVAGVKDRGIG
jgi:hypothetical protein